jgi:cytoskeletal protein RodZ
MGPAHHDRRFDYLFQPLPPDESAAVADEAGESDAACGVTDRTRGFARAPIVRGSVVVAATALGLAAAFTFWRHPGSTAPPAGTDMAPPTSTATTAPTEVAIVSTPADLPAVPVSPPASTADAPAATQPSPGGENNRADVPMSPAPETRAPISVRPEPHPAFPNQTPPAGADRKSPGGLLGHLPVLG